METKLNLPNLIEQTKNKHIVICGNYRTGSNAFGNFLSSQTNNSFISEPFIPSNKSETLGKLNTLIQNNKKVIVNIHPDQFTTQVESFLNSPKVRGSVVFIQLTRLDVIKQMVSLHIMRRNKWRNFNNEQFIVDSDYDDIMVTVERICTTNKQQQQQNFDFITKINYEEILPLLNEHSDRRTPRPYNYNALYSAVGQVYQIFLKENPGFFGPA